MSTRRESNLDPFKVYKFFAHLFAYPERGEEFFKNLERFYPFDDLTPLEELKRIPFEELQAEYTSLFVARYGGVPCKPYESFFSAEKTLMGGAAFDTAKYYELFGLQLPPGEMPDAVYLQLDFAAFLVKLLEESTDPEDRKKIALLYRDFFKKHILWMEKFADCIVENSSLEPLKVFADKFKEFLREERKRLKL